MKNLFSKKSQRLRKIRMQIVGVDIVVLHVAVVVVLVPAMVALDSAQANAL